jgi:hypothetical protein
MYKKSARLTLVSKRITQPAMKGSFFGELFFMEKQKNPLFPKGLRDKKRRCLFFNK